MSRLGRYEENRWLGDKRVQVVHDQDNACDRALLEEIHAAGAGIVFGPDTEAEARNRGYRVCRSCAANAADAA